MNKYNLKMAALLSLAMVAGLSAQMTQDQVLVNLKSKLDSVNSYFEQLKKQADQYGINETNFKNKLDEVKSKIKSSNFFEAAKLKAEEVLLAAKLKNSEGLSAAVNAAKNQLSLVKEKFQNALNSFKNLSEKERAAWLEKNKELLTERLSAAGVSKEQTTGFFENASNWFNNLVGNTTTTTATK